MGLYTTTTTMSVRMVGVNFSATNMTTLGGYMIDDAEAEINKYLSKRYDLSGASFQTTTSIPPLVRALANKLSEGYMWQQLSRGGAGQESLARGSALIKSVIDNLVLISTYKEDLVNTAGSVISDMSQTGMRVLCNTSGYIPTFGEDDPELWQIDSTKLDDLETDRS